MFSLHALWVYLFAGFVLGLIAYAGFAWLGGRFGSVRTSLVLYIGPVASALLSGRGSAKGRARSRSRAAR